VRWACASACSWTRCPSDGRRKRRTRRRPRRALHRGLRRLARHTAAQQSRGRATPTAARAALAAGLGVNAGHDLNRDNLADFLRAVPGVQEVSIGHAFIADALELGYAAATRDYLRCIDEAQ
jgi:pyridoxine 5'-phosphate synthase PdxJ